MKAAMKMMFIPMILLMLAVSANASERHYEVYYFHASWRCANCTNAEAYTQEAVNSYNAENPGAGVIFKPVQLETNDALVRALGANRVDAVVVEVMDGKIISHKNIGNLLPLIGNKANVVAKVKDGVGSFVTGK